MDIVDQIKATLPRLTAGYLTPHYRVIVPDHIGFGESLYRIYRDWTGNGEGDAESL